MSFTKVVPKKNNNMLYGPRAKCGYDWWWHSLTARNKETGEERPFFFEYYICNPALGKKEPIFGQVPGATIENPVKPSYVMVKGGTWLPGGFQLHRFFGWKQDGVKVAKGTPFSVTTPDCYCDDNHIKGKIHISEADAKAHPEWMCDAGDLEWDLTVKHIIPWNVGYGTSQLFLRLNAFNMYWHGAGMKTEYSGTITADGVEYVVTPETCYGYADKNFGQDFTTPWLWLSSCNLYSNKKHKQLENSVFDIGGGAPIVFGIKLDRKLLGAMYYEGKKYEFNFSKLWTFCRTKFNCYETGDEIIWKVTQKTLKGKIVYDLHCKKEDMLLVNYEAPNGIKRHNHLWNGGNGKGHVKLYRNLFGFLPILIDDMTVRNMGCEYGEYDRLKNTDVD